MRRARGERDLRKPARVAEMARRGVQRLERRGKLPLGHRDLRLEQQRLPEERMGRVGLAKEVEQPRGFVILLQVESQLCQVEKSERVPARRFPHDPAFQFGKGGRLLARVERVELAEHQLQIRAGRVVPDEFLDPVVRGFRPLEHRAPVGDP